MLKGNMADRVRLGVVGLGNIGTSHIRSHLPKVPRLELAAVAEQDPERRAKFSEVPGFATTQEMVDSGLVDAVLIGTPHFDHTKSGIAALGAGLHTLVEKPISVHVADAKRLIAAHKSGVFAAMFNQRTDPVYRAVRELIQSGELGELRRVNWTATDWFRPDTYYASGGWRATWAGEGGGVLLNQAPHNLDLYYWLFGSPARIRASIGLGRFHDIEVEDDVTAFFEHENGMKGVFITTTGECPGTNRLEIAGDRGKVVVEGGKITFARTPRSVEAFLRDAPGAFDSMDTWKAEIPPARGGGEQHVGILKNFAEAILDGKPLIAPASEGMASVELANAMILSGLEDRTVDLPLDAEHYESVLNGLIANSKRTMKVDEAVAETSGSY
ncbi:Gfo/Idh/MocA family oxidoreductase [soil metagenome]